MNRLETLPLSALVAGRNPRGHFDEAELAELVASIKANGVAQPILVRPLDEATYQIIAGERRVRASRLALGEDATIPAMVSDVSEDEAQVLALVENTVRAAMSPTEEACAADAIVRKAKGDKAEAAAQLGWPLSKLDRRLALMNLAPQVRAALDRRAIRLGHAELLAAVSPDRQVSALNKIIDNNLTAAQVKTQLSALAQQLSSAVFDLAGCQGCPYNSSVQRSMFDEAIDATASCTNPACWGQKTNAWIDERRAALQEQFPRVVVLEPGATVEPIRLVAEGRLGVGQAQALACKGCANFGATLSALPGSAGAVEEGLCFDGACHTVKVAAQLKASSSAAGATASPAASTPPKAKTKPAQSSPTAATASSASSADDESAATAVAPAPTTVTLSNRLKDHVITVWRSVLARHVYAHPDTAIAVLLALGLSSRSRCVDSSKLAAALGSLSPPAGESTTVSLHDFGAAIKAASAVADPARTRLLHAMAASAFKEVDTSALKAAAHALDVRLVDYWKLDEATLTLLTKSELVPLANEVGLVQALGGDAALKKALALPKPEAIKALLGVAGFDYRVAPSFMAL
jgi:PRTRC genetic system ParB family protein